MHVKKHLQIYPPRLCFLLSHQNKVRPKTTPPPLFRRNSFDPLSTQDQIKRPRLYSTGNFSQSNVYHTATIPSMPFSDVFEGVESQQNEVSVILTCDCFKTVCTMLSKDGLIHKSSLIVGTVYKIILKRKIEVFT